MSYSIVFYDDARARSFEPFALSRPFCEMRVGALLVRERWEHALRATSISFVSGAQLVHFTEAGAPAFAQGVILRGTVLVNSRAAVPLSHGAFAWMRKEDATASPEQRAWYVDGRLAALQLREDIDVSALLDGSLSLETIALQQNAESSARVESSGYWIDEVWDIVRHLTPMLCEDIPHLAKTLPCSEVKQRPSNAIHPPLEYLTGANPAFVEQGANVEPFTVFDTTLGPILVRTGATVQSFTRVVGPCYIGQHSTVVGDRISGSSIGDTCRVHGELSATVFVGHSNKGHDGFVGHSIVGRWVNMGAGTITSNLKNTYGSVALWTPDGVRNTNMQFLGTLFGDHAKTGIGVKLTTGCVLGTGANVFDRMPPKAVEPFAWGSGAPYDSYSIDKFVDTAARMMERRHVTLDERGQQHLRDVHGARWRVS